MGKLGIPQKTEWFRQQTKKLLTDSVTSDALMAYCITVYSVMQPGGLNIAEIKSTIEAELGTTVNDNQVSDLILSCKPRHVTGNRCQSCGGGLRNKPLVFKGTTICQTPEAHEVTLATE